METRQIFWSSKQVVESMKRSCEHCGELIVGGVYRVTSKQDGITLLNLVVCSLCSIEAKRLRLHTEEISISSNPSSARNRESRR
jgi:hypothetical protein